MQVMKYHRNEWFEEDRIQFSIHLKELLFELCIWNERLEWFFTHIMVVIFIYDLKKINVCEKNLQKKVLNRHVIHLIIIIIIM